MGLLLRRWWALVLSPIPASIRIGVAFVANPTGLWSGEPGGLWGVVILTVWGILPGFYGLVIGLLTAQAMEGRRTG